MNDACVCSFRLLDDSNDKLHVGQQTQNAYTSHDYGVKFLMAQRRKKRYTRNEKIFYVLSLLIVFSMILSMIYLVIAPTGGGAGVGF